jgi:enamine deaminase RidA (YjgF/YER057c/UK114 family)
LLIAALYVNITGEMMSDITRIDSGKRMSQVVTHKDIVYLSGMTPDDADQDIQGQTQQVLRKVDASLAKAGIDKNRLLSAHILLKNIERDFEGMNKVWEAWIPAGGAPTRATSEAKLARSSILVEIIVTAAAVERTCTA